MAELYLFLLFLLVMYSATFKCQAAKTDLGHKLFELQVKGRLAEGIAIVTSGCTGSTLGG
jgi:hypothetical protein